MVPLLLFLREKPLGISSSYRFVGSLTFPKIPYFNYKRSDDVHQVQFAVGLILSGLAASFVCGDCVSLPANPQKEYEIVSTTIYDLKNAIQFFVGGILVGFGARYANGCTAGHCIMGVSQFATSSILATVAFFIGGLLASYFINPFIF
jgi:uncharacterized membrane protein YedE/YeeE